MDKKKIKRLSAISLLVVLMVASAFSQSSNSAVKTENLKVSSTNTSAPGEKQKITFIELGSVRCIPCQQMQAVMKSIETKYSKDVKIEFHDVWTEEGKPYGVKYGIEAIPTQVFLDETGKEYYRHVGYFPEEELVKILQMKGVKLN